MRYDVGNDWILFKKLTLKAYQLEREGLFLEALPDLIIDWSFDLPINYKNILKLKGGIIKELKMKIFESAEPILTMDKDILAKWVKLMIDGFQPSKHVLSEEEYNNFIYIKEKYFAFALLYTDHKGNIINLPEKGGILEQPIDWVLFLTFLKTAFIQKQIEEQKKQ